jgi:hypothetical protein
MTPAQASGIDLNNGWGELIDKATSHKEKPKIEAQTQPITQMVKVK